jgi:cytochrome b561
MKKILSAALLAATLAAAPAFAKSYTVDKAASSVTFEGTYNDKPFDGKIGDWQAEIDFDPAALQASHIKVTFETQSIKTGNAMYDGALPQADWFDAKNHPQAVFTSTALTKQDDGSYKAAGGLTIRGITHPAEIAFTLSDLSQAPVKATGSLTIDRLAYGIGKGSDEKAEWVGKDVKVSFAITAN